MKLILSLPSLFAAAFVAATLIPAQSELLLAAMVAGGGFDPVSLLLVATCGNVAGSTVNWLLGRFLNDYRDRRWFPFSAEQLERAQARYARWGIWTLLLSWVPIIGDPLTFVSGLMRTPLRLFLPLVTLAKAGRYLVIILAMQGFA